MATSGGSRATVKASAAKRGDASERCPRTGPQTRTVTTFATAGAGATVRNRKAIHAAITCPKNGFKMALTFPFVICLFKAAASRMMEASVLSVLSPLAPFGPYVFYLLQQAKRLALAAMGSSCASAQKMAEWLITDRNDGGRRARRRSRPPEHDPEKWLPVLGQDQLDQT